MISNGICGNPIRIGIVGLLSAPSVIIDEFNLNTGSVTYQEQPQPANIVLRGRDRYPLSTKFIGRKLTVYVADPTLGNKYIFVGQITNISNTLITDDQAQFEISAVSYINELLTLDTGGNGFPAQNDMERLNAIFETATANEWQDFDTVTTWQALGEVIPTTTWEQFNSFYGRNFTWEVTGTPEANLISYPAQNATAYDLASDIASNLRGRLFENIESGSSVITYFTRSMIQSDLYTPHLTIGNHNILRDSVAMSADIANLANNVILDNGTNARSDANYFSIQTYGLRQIAYDSPLANTADLQTFATEFLKSADLARDLITTVGIVINENTMTSAEAYAAIECMHAPLSIQIEDLPTGIRGRFGQSPQWAIPTGASASYSNGNLIIQYNLAIATQVLPADRWTDLNPTTIWTGFYTPSTTWAEIG